MSLPRDYFMVRENDLNCFLHINPELEIVYVKKGPFHIKSENGEMTLNDNEATVILPYRLHSFSHRTGADAKILLFSYSIAEEFYKNYRAVQMKNDRFTVSPVLENYIQQGLSDAIQNKSVFAIKSIFFPLVAEYLKNNECVGRANAGTNEVCEIVDYISDKVTEGITADDVAKELGISKTRINRVFRECLGIGFNEFITVVRIEKAYNMLLSTDLNVTEIAYLCSFGSVRNFNRSFMKIIGCTPSRLRKMGGNRFNIYEEY
ncbi:MAG: helix-turn-helix transcriptional regulator [Clostridia bacterium]|nr:helix-turn-helix transcriptional regulator [Clostridia bacterium]